MLPTDVDSGGCADSHGALHRRVQAHLGRPETLAGLWTAPLASRSRAQTTRRRLEAPGTDGLVGSGRRRTAHQALAAAGLKLEQIDRVEVNEAFRAQYLAVEKALGLHREKTNVNGGAIALGAPARRHWHAVGVDPALGARSPRPALRPGDGMHWRRAGYGHDRRGHRIAARSGNASIQLSFEGEFICRFRRWVWRAAG